MENKQAEWHYQWSQLGDRISPEDEILFWEWISPLTREDFTGKRVVDAGCGDGHMLSYLVPSIDRGVGVDLNTVDVVRKRFADVDKISLYEGDISTWSEEDDFDIVYSIGVVHHTPNPKKTIRNLMQLVRPGGRIAFWVYSKEGNWLNWAVLEPAKSIFLQRFSRKTLWSLSVVLTFLMSLPIYTIYLLPLRFLPYYDYFRNWRRLPFMRNALNVFDKLNAPTTHFISREDIDDWFKDMPFHDLTVNLWKGVGWSVSAVKKPASETQDATNTTME